MFGLRNILHNKLRILTFNYTQNMTSLRLRLLYKMKSKPSAQFDRNVVLKASLHVLGEHNGMKTEFYRTNTKSQDLVPVHFALIIIIVVHV